MEISRNNIEYYLAMYFDRTLDPVRTAELMLFLAENPDLEHLIELPGRLSLYTDDNPFPGKELLRKDFKDVATINKENFEEFCIASMEGLLGESEEKRLKDYIAQHPERNKDALIYKQLKLVSDLQIRFPGKSALKKLLPRIHGYRIWIMLTGIAAAVALAVMVIIGRTDRISRPESYTAQHQAPAVIQKDPPVNNTIPEQVQENPAGQIPDPSTGMENLSVTGQMRQGEKPLAETRITAAGSNDEELVQTATASKDRIQALFGDEIQTFSTESKNDFPLQSLDPHYEIQLAAFHPTEKTLVLSKPGNNAIDGSSLLSQENPEAEQQRRGLMDFIRDLDAWKTTLYAVKGFNALTESSLSLEKTTDNEGKMTGLIIDTERYTLLATSSE